MTTSASGWQHHAACTSHDQTHCSECSIAVGADDGNRGGPSEDERRLRRRRRAESRTVVLTSPPIVLFVGDDASSTQIAESLLRQLLGDHVEIHTAGAKPPHPGGREDQMLVMMGLNPAHEERLSLRALTTSDRVIVLGTSLDVARVPGRPYEVWDLDDGSLEERIEALATELTITPDTQPAVAPPPTEHMRRRLAGQKIRRRIKDQVTRQRDLLTRRLASVRRRGHRRIHD